MEINRDINKILLLRLDQIGDLLLTTPAIHALRESYPGAEIHLLINSFTAEVVTGNPDIDKIIPFNRAYYNANIRKPGTLIKLLKFFKELRKEKYDLIVIFPRFFNYALLAFFIGAPVRLGLDTFRRGFLLTHRIPDPGPIHEADLNNMIIEQLGAEVRNKELRFYFNREDAEYVDKLLASKGYQKGELLIGLHPAASRPARDWPPGYFAKLGDMLVSRLKAKVFFTGGPGDMEKVNKIIKDMEYPAVSLAGKTSIKQLGAFIKSCDLYAGNDTGPLHLAVAVKTPSIAFFGAVDPRQFGPYGDRERHIILKKNVPCRPCNEFVCPRPGHDCMTKLTPEEVYDAVYRHLKKYCPEKLPQ